MKIFKDNISNSFNCINCCKLVKLPEFKYTEEYIKCDCHYSYLISKIGKCTVVFSSNIFSKKAKNQKQVINTIENSLRHSCISKTGFSSLSAFICSFPHFSSGNNWVNGVVMLSLSMLCLLLVIVEYKLIRKGIAV